MSKFATAVRRAKKQVATSVAKTPQAENKTVNTTTPAQSTATSPTPKYRKGEMVRPLRKVNYDGRRLRQYDDVYTIFDDVYGDRAVLTARGQIWAVMNVSDIERA